MDWIARHPEGEVLPNDWGGLFAPLAGAAAVLVKGFRMVPRPRTNSIVVARQAALEPAQAVRPEEHPKLGANTCLPQACGSHVSTSAAPANIAAHNLCQQLYFLPLPDMEENAMQPPLAAEQVGPSLQVGCCFDCMLRHLPGSQVLDASAC